MVAQETGHILIADDEEGFRLTMSGLLRREGYDCDCVPTSEEALACLKKPYDLLIADIHMPGNMDMEFLQEVHQNVPTLPIIVVTGHPSFPTALEALHLSVVDYLVKPVKMPIFLTQVAEGIQRGKILRVVRQTQQTAREWAAATDSLEKSLERPGQGGENLGMAWSLDRYLEQVVGNMATLIGGVQRALTQVQLNGREQAVDMCAIMSCPRLAAYESVLQETVSVLEKTKRAFKSKDLAELRKNIETLLKTAKRIPVEKTERT